MKKKIDYKVCKGTAGHPKFSIRWPDEIPDKITFMALLKGLRIERKLLNDRANYLALCIAIMVLEEAISDIEMKKIKDLLPRGGSDEELYIVTLSAVSAFRLDKKEIADIDGMTAVQLEELGRKLLAKNNQIMVTGTGRIFYGKDYSEDED